MNIYVYLYIYVCVCLYVGVLCDVVDLISGSCGLELAVPTFCRIRNCGAAKAATWHPRRGVHVCYWVLRFKH